MRRRLFRALLVVVSVLSSISLHARSHAIAIGVPGQFDYYLLDLSWSPEFCATRTAPTGECAAGRHFGFLLHGLWPQYLRGYPSDCGRVPALTPEDVRPLLALMPSPALVQHEWQKHGTCSGLSAKAYTADLESAYRHVTIPAAYQMLAQPLTQSLSTLKSALRDANPQFAPESIHIQCRSRFVSEISFCLDKSLQPTECGTDIRDRCPERVTFRPVR